MANIISIFLILLISLFFSVIFRKKIEETISFTTLGIIILIYLVGLFNNLLVGYYSVIALAFICLVFLTINYKRLIISNILTPGLLFFIFIFILGVYINRFSFAGSWDEAAHWGLTVKNMFMLDKFSTVAQSNIIYRDYAPGTAVFHYFWIRSSSVFDERLLFVSMDVLIGSFLCTVLKDYSFKDWKKLFILFPILLFAPLSIYIKAYTGIIVEPILGILSAFILYIYFSYGINTFSLLTMSFGLFVLVIIKSTGLIFACIILLIICVDILCVKKINIFAEVKKIKKKSKILLFIIMIISPFLAHFTWKINLAMNQVHPTWKIDILSIIRDIIINYKNLPLYKIDGAKNFLASFFNLNASWSSELSISFFRIPYFVLLLYIAILIFALWLTNKKDRSIVVVSIILYVFSLIYTLTTLILALSQFSENEISGMYASNRYSLVFILALFMLIIFLFMKNASGKKWSAAFVCFSIVFLLMYNMNNFKELNPMGKYNGYQSRQKSLAANTELLNYVGYSDCLLIYGSYDYIIYDCAPMKTTLLTSDFTYYQSNYSNYDYLYLNGVESIIMNDDWKIKFGDLFSDVNTIRDHSIYKIVYDNGIAKLDFIATIGT